MFGDGPPLGQSFAAPHIRVADFDVAEIVVPHHQAPAFGDQSEADAEIVEILKHLDVCLVVLLRHVLRVAVLRCVSLRQLVEKIVEFDQCWHRGLLDLCGSVCSHILIMQILILDASEK